MNGNLIERACQAIPDPYFVVVHNGWLGGGTAQIPDAVGWFSIHPALDRLRLAKGVGQRHVVPARGGGEPLTRSPAMPVSIVSCSLGGKQKVQPGLSLHAGDSQCPILIVLFESGAPCAPLAYDVLPLPIVHLLWIDPGFQGDGIAIGKIKRALLITDA